MLRRGRLLPLVPRIKGASPTRNSANGGAPRPTVFVLPGCTYVAHSRADTVVNEVTGLETTLGSNMSGM
jgi:hypothetical protein